MRFSVSLLSASVPDLSTTLNGLDLVSPLTQVSTWFGSMVNTLAPVGIGVMILFSSPRLIKRLVLAWIR